MRKSGEAAKGGVQRMTANIEKNSAKRNSKEKCQTEELASLIARLPEQEQAKIYYMLKGFEIFGKPVVTGKH